MSSDAAPRFETRHQFVERVIARFADRKIPDRVIARMVRPLLTGEVPYDPVKERNLMTLVCEDAQDRASFRRHFLGGE